MIKPALFWISRATSNFVALFIIPYDWVLRFGPLNSAGLVAVLRSLDRSLNSARRSARASVRCGAMTTPILSQHCWVSPSFILIIHVVNPGARNGILLISHGRPRLPLSWGRSRLHKPRSFCPPSTSTNYRFSFAHSFPHCSLFSFSRSLDDSFDRGRYSLFHEDSNLLLLVFHICTITLQLDLTLDFPSPIVSAFLLSKPRTLITPQFQCFLPALDIDYDILPCEAPSKSTLFSPPSILPLPLYLDCSHDSLHNCRHINLNIVSSGYVDAKAFTRSTPIPPRNLVSPRNLLAPSCLILAADTLAILRLFGPVEDHGTHYPSASGAHLQHPRKCSQKTHLYHTSIEGERGADAERGRLWSDGVQVG